MCFCMFIKQLGLLIFKNGIYMWRTKLWTIFEIIIPLIISLPIVYAVLEYAPKGSVEPERFYESFKVTGNWRDLKRPFTPKTIYKRYCNRDLIFLGFAYKEDVDKLEVNAFKNQLEARYNVPQNDAFNISVHIFRSEIELNDILINDTKNRFGDPNCGRYMGGVVFKTINLNAPLLRYQLRFQDEDLGRSRWYTGDEQWIEGRPFKIMEDIFHLPGKPNYWATGFLSLQYAIDTIFIQRRTFSLGENESAFSLELERLPQPAYNNQSVMTFLKFLAYFWPIIAIPFLLHTTSLITSEKESGMKAYLSVMGLNSSTYYLSYAIIGFIKMAIAFVPCAIMLLPSFKKVEPSLFLVTTLIYCVCVITFAMLLSSVFHRSGSAVKGGLFIWLASLLANLAPIPQTKIIYSLLASLNVNFALNKAIDAMQDHSMRELHLNWLNIFDESLFNISFGLALSMMIFDIIWMILLLFYLDNVYPPGDLPRKHLFYFLCPAQKDVEADENKGDTESDIDETDTNENIQPPDSAPGIDNADVEVRQLTKMYSENVAVDSISFRACRDNVTVLLGHNGAGKSTTFGMLTGLATPTEGTVRICGTRLNSSSLSTCQQNIGFCPQYNPIFDLLTVKEHLRFFRCLKGNEENNLDVLLEELQLSEKPNCLAKTLSGGMKRKLCVGMALVGGCRVILLDEPTAGMDPSARRAVCDVIERWKHGRTVLLTTHYMDEADVLGDRIMIMVNGRIACAGTSEFLKSRFGTGYLLTIALKENTPLSKAKVAAILEAVRFNMPNAKVQSSTARQLTILLPVEHKSKFSALFAHLEVHGDTLGIDSFGVALNTLEQVFLNVGEIAEPSPKNHDATDIAKRQAALICDQTSQARSGMTLWLRRLGALLHKRAISHQRHVGRLIPQLFIPLLILGGYYLLTNRTIWKEHIREIDLGVEELSPALIAVQEIQKSNETSRFAHNVSRMVERVSGYELLWVDNIKDMKRVLVNRPMVLPAVAAGLISNFTSVTAFFSAQARHGPVITTTIVSNARLGTSPDSILVSLFPYGVEQLEFNTIGERGQIATLSAIIVAIFPLITCGFVMQIVDEESCNFIHQQLLTGLSQATYWFSVLLSDILLYSTVCISFLIIFGVTKWMYGFKIDVLLLWILYFWQSVPLVYITGSLFKSTTKAYVLLLIFTWLTPPLAFVLALVFMFLGTSISSLANTAFTILLPGYAMSRALGQLVMASENKQDLYSWASLGQVVCLMFISGVIFWCLFVAIKLRFFAHLRRFAWSIRAHRESINWNLVDEDVDVREERYLVERSADGEFAICLRRIEKYYGHLHAVRNLTFSVGPDECFGLLGINGAGKTSTFDILTGTSLCDGGYATINGRSVSCRQTIGYCPQFDALLGDLTARETLTLMVALRGFTDVKKRVRNVLDSISLSSEADMLVRWLSGGQRRRLGVGLAVISQARVIMLDEPTAGIDPKTRRQIWNLLSAMREERCAILLTSHSMDECEALCTRIGIMHTGALCAVGSAQHIKSRFGEGYALTVTLKNSNGRDDVVDAVAKEFPRANLKTLHPSSRLVWHIPKADGDKWSNLFKRLNRFAVSQSNVYDYSLAQATLEEAFLRLSQNDDESPISRRNSPLDLSPLV